MTGQASVQEEGLMPPVSAVTSGPPAAPGLTAGEGAVIAGQAGSGTARPAPGGAGARSLKAELARLRARMCELGLGHDEIAAEIGRQYRARPREAWRLAWGWTLNEAAARFNARAARAGTDPAGAATMTGPHLCEYEKWPSSRRRPSVYVLSMLAATYQASVASLLDLADHAALPRPDRLVLLRAPGAGELIAAGPRTGAQPALAWDQAGQGVSLTLPYVPGRLVIEVSVPPGAGGLPSGGSDTPRAAGLLTLVPDPPPAQGSHR